MRQNLLRKVPATLAAAVSVVSVLAAAQPSQAQLFPGKVFSCTSPWTAAYRETTYGLGNASNNMLIARPSITPLVPTQSDIMIFTKVNQYDGTLITGEQRCLTVKLRLDALNLPGSPTAAELVPDIGEVDGGTILCYRPIDGMPGCLNYIAPDAAVVNGKVPARPPYPYQSYLITNLANSRVHPAEAFETLTSLFHGPFLRSASASRPVVD